MREYPDCFERTLLVGHVTASAWILDPTRTKVLLTHHKKLGKWLQLGGHTDGDANVLHVALREAHEESGIDAEAIQPLSDAIFDLDIHPIPARTHTNKDGSYSYEPEHFHYDVRFLLQAATTEFIISEESLNLSWIDVDKLHTLTDDDSVMRMKEKWLNLRHTFLQV